jgi:uncharacterized protein (TIGR02118 family)
MIKLTFCVRRLPHLTREEFDQYWFEQHAGLVSRHAEALRIKRYVQVPVLNRPSAQESIRTNRNAMDMEYDGVAELWWESLQDLAEAAKNEEGRKASQALLEDEKRFIDLEKSSIWYGQEREIFSKI